MKLDKPFSINAKTCTLKYNNQDEKATVLDGKTKYIIPIYQRPYSWSDEQLRKFISDIFISFWGSEGNSSGEPMFIGTMQLSKRNQDNTQDIIDGQQRLTTFLVFLKVLKQRFPENEMLMKIDLDWLSTRVNSGKQQFYLEELILGDLVPDDETLNPYFKNALLINKLIEGQIKDDEGNALDFNIDKFLNHLLGNIYFVVIETQAGLSKTLQIFNAINTTGLDLNGGDIFKIRMYEYLKDRKNKDESTFDEISRLYHKIDEYNSLLKYKAADINDVLSIYQYILIAKYSLPVVLYSYATSTFFERLFDTMFKINQWEHFKNNVKNIELSIEAIEEIIEVRYEWENDGYKTCEDACAMHFIWLSRYSKYWALTFVFLYKFKDEDDYWNKMLEFVRQLSKLYTIYSIRFLKAINEIHSFTYLLIKEIVNSSYEDVMKTLNQKIGKLEDHRGYNGWGDLENALTGDITYNARIKNIICRLSAMLYEDYKTMDEIKIEEIRTALFEKDIDIEHIQAYHDKNGDRREDIWNEWKENINSIGNLMVLEQDINRSISNNLYEVKIERYPQSIFTVVKEHCNSYSYWDLSKCLERKTKERDRILNYIFN